MWLEREMELQAEMIYGLISVRMVSKEGFIFYPKDDFK